MKSRAATLECNKVVLLGMRSDDPGALLTLAFTAEHNAASAQVECPADAPLAAPEK